MVLEAINLYVQFNLAKYVNIYADKEQSLHLPTKSIVYSSEQIEENDDQSIIQMYGEEMDYHMYSLCDCMMDGNEQFNQDQERSIYKELDEIQDIVHFTCCASP